MRGKWGKCCGVSEMYEFKEFRIGDLFEIQTGSLVQSSTLTKGSIPRVSVTSANNGIVGYFDTESNKDARHFENFISVNFFGNAFYHSKKSSVEMKVHVLVIPNYSYTRETALYIITALNKVLNDQFSYGEQLSSSDLKNNSLYISLPVTKAGEIDFEYMVSYIRELVAYLKVTGLTDYKLTADEEQFLEEYRTLIPPGGVKLIRISRCESYLNLRVTPS